LVEQDNGAFEFDFDPRHMPEFQSDIGAAYFQIWLPGGEVLGQSPSLEGSQLNSFFDETGDPVFRYSVLPNGRHIRAVGFAFVPRRENPWMGKRPSTEASLVLVVAKDTSGMERKVRFVRWLLVGAGSLTLVMSLLAAALVVRGGLKPLQTLEGRIAGIHEDELSDRLPKTDMPSELEPVITKLNILLDRLERAFARERAFTADVAHELRTPLSGIRSTLEVALSRARDATEYREALADTLAIADRMQSMVDTLLFLAKLDRGQAVPSFKKILVAQLIDACWEQYAKEARSRNISFENSVSSQLSIESSYEMVSMVMSILLDNASGYADEGGRIWVSGNKVDDAIEITVANTGCRLSPEEVDHVFDRLWRGDPSRSSGRGAHFGLGLSLAQRTMLSLDGNISASVDNGNAFKVKIRFPCPGELGKD
jgi:signal transduction histidine kinase